MRNLVSILKTASWFTILIAFIQFSPPSTAGAGYQILTVRSVDTTEGQMTEFNLISQVSEAVTKPNTPSGPNIGTVGTRYTYSTGGSFSNLGHSVQYFFDWGDGTGSGWLPAEITTASKSWSSAGTYFVKVRARCATETSAVTSWSGARILML